MTLTPNTRDLLIEVGTEELPASSQKGLASNLLLAVNNLLERNYIPAKTGTCFSTPRRIAVLVCGVPIRQSDRTFEKKGPSLDAAFDEKGQPTAAALGFARSVNASLDTLEQRSSDNGAWLWYRGAVAGRETIEILTSQLAPILETLPVARRMRWGAGDASFLRPVRWLVVKFGEQNVKCHAFGQEASDTTRGHRALGSTELNISRPIDYENILKSAYVIASADEREKMVREQIKEGCHRLDCLPVAQDELVEEICGMVEWPSAVIGKFEEQYLRLPEEVILSTLISHQRFVPMRDTHTKALKPVFLAICNLPEGMETKIRRGLEKVVRPRLADAEFYYFLDRKRSLSSYQKDLEGIGFAPKLGNMLEKTERLVSLVTSLSKLFDCDPLIAGRAASLCKCDLATGLVFEFPELQGVLGGEYAREDGEEQVVAQAISEHYQPSGPGDEIPTTVLGQLIAITDRLDTLIGGFAAGLKATATKDAFGMRRSAFGIIRIAVDRPLGNLRALLNLAASQYPPQLAATSHLDSATEFLTERLRSYLRNAGHRPDVIAAVLQVAVLDPWDILQRVSAIETLASRSDFVSLVEVNKRLANILHGFQSNDEWRPAGGEPREETELARSYLSISPEVEASLDTGNYLKALEKLTQLREPLDKFFTEVLVMDEDASIRNRRLTLLHSLYVLCRRVADISLLQPTESAG